MEIINKMRFFGENISNERIIKKVLINLPRKYDSIVAAIKESKDLSKMSVAELMGSLKVHKQRLSRRHKSSLASAFQSKLNVKSNNLRNGRNYYQNQNKDFLF